ncbi:MAG: yfhC [Chlamydiales bacterium]|jgi:tRNA(adenine34) deaminase|nr:yfhC [Chlamydiales bacterium]
MQKISDKQDHDYMQIALLEAQKAFDKGEVPIGAALVYQGQVIAQAHNQVETKNSALNHAEILCLQQGSVILNNWRLLETTLYCTLEPCCMCAGAMLLSRIKRLVWAAPDIRHGAHGSWTDLFSLQHPCHHIEVTHGIHQQESARLLKEFFRKRRIEKNKEKNIYTTQI